MPTSMAGSMRSTPTFGKAQSVGSAPAATTAAVGGKPQSGVSTPSSAPVSTSTSKTKSPEKPVKQTSSQSKPPLHAPKGTQVQASSAASSNSGSELEYGFIPKHVLAALNDKSDYKVCSNDVINWACPRLMQVVLFVASHVCLTIPTTVCSLAILHASSSRFPTLTENRSDSMLWKRCISCFFAWKIQQRYLLTSVDWWI
jgi:hypothetical protein